MSWTNDGPTSRDTLVLVEPGSSLTSAAHMLERVGVIDSADTFLLQARLLGSSGDIKAGEYEVPAGASSSEVLALLQSGKTVQRFVTVPEGTPSVLVHEALMKARLLTGDVAVPEEGSVLPDTYSYRRGEARSAVLARMQEAMDRELDRLWAQRSPDTPVETKSEAVTLASIVEKETAKPSERRLIAGVYANRLRRGMKLDADPTIIYPITRGRPLGRAIRRSEIDAVNDYNTYSMVGLPKGPITNPGREALAAALNPADTDALYLVADGTGGHIFSETLADHNRAHQAWRKIRAAKIARERAAAD